MKTKFRIKQFLKNFFTLFLIVFHILHIGLCRPSTPRNVDYPNDGKGRQSQVRPPVYDLRNVGPTEIYTMRGGRRLKNNDTLLLYSDSDDDFRLSFVSDDVGSLIVVNIDDDIESDTSRPTRDDALDKEGSVQRHRQVVPFRDRNLVRKRRQPELHKPHRRRRRKHRLVLKARDRNHLLDGGGEDELKDHRRERFLIKSDSPGYVITSASEVKKDWCRTIPLRQKVSEPHCRSRVVQNNFCYGQCNSFFIPHTGRTDSKVAFQSCAFCKPFKQHWGNVTLNCPGRNPPKIEKTVLFVETCRCITEVFQ